MIDRANTMATPGELENRENNPSAMAASSSAGEEMIATQKRLIGSLASFWRHGTRAERVGYVVGTLLLLSGLVHLTILIASGSSWDGPLSLRKPSSFGLSFGLTLISIVWVSTFIAVSARTRAILLGGFTGACALETILVTLQTWRGVPSHFNLETTFDALVARILAFGGVTLVIVVVAFTLASFRANAGVPIRMRIAIRVGFVALFGAQVAGVVMIAWGMMLVFRGNPHLAYAAGGFLKPTHAVTMHGVLLLPALAWLLSFANWSERRRLICVLFAVSGYLLLIAVVVVANVAGISLSQMPPLLNALAALAVLSLAVPGGLALVAVTRTSNPADGLFHR